MSQSEHYVGPVFFRYVGLTGKEGYVIQVRHLGFFGEAGTQWGLSVGLTDRVAAAPRIVDAEESYRPVEVSRWSTPLSFLSPQVDRAHIAP